MARDPFDGFPSYLGPPKRKSVVGLFAGVLLINFIILGVTLAMIAAAVIFIVNHV